MAFRWPDASRNENKRRRTDSGSEDENDGGWRNDKSGSTDVPYISQQVSHTFHVHLDLPLWTCQQCNAEWLVMDAPPNIPGVVQIVFHPGGQVAFWPRGQAGLCRCGVYWAEANPNASE